jgi:PAS domain S-box-containing protein
VLEQPFAESLTRWLTAMGWFAMAAVLTLAFIGFMTAALMRSLGARERAHADLEAARQELQHQLAFVALLLETSPTPLSTTDAQGRYLSVNRAWEDFTGHTRAQVIGRAAAAFMPPDDAMLHREREAEVWRNGQSLRYESRVQHGDGSRRDVVVTKLLVPGDERFAARLLGTMMDVSEFREAERATREARDAAEESSRAKSEFIANISHELRTPLQSILGFSELGLMRGAHFPKLHAMFTDIHASGSRMLALVNDLLDVARIDSAVGAVTLEHTDLRGLIADVLRELKPQLDAKDLRVEHHPGAQPVCSRVDPARFAQVIRNVTANAIKFSPQGSVIDITADEAPAGSIRIRIRDHGVGIPAGETEKIFEAFVQSSKTKDGSGGTGLGLAICRKILEVHGGTISADNMPDGGAVFTICLAAAEGLEAGTKT